MSDGKGYGLEDRLVDFSVVILDVVDLLPDTKAGNHVAGQLVRAGAAAAPNYAESQSAESRKHYIHKVRVALKELKESRVWLKVILRKRMIAGQGLAESTFAECEELIRILGKSAATAAANLGREGGP